MKTKRKSLIKKGKPSLPKLRRLLISLCAAIVLILFSTAELFSQSLSCPITPCNLVPNGGFEILSPSVISATSGTPWFYDMTDNTLPNDNVCGWAKSHNAPPKIWGTAAGNHYLHLIGGYWSPPYGGYCSTVHNLVNNGNNLDLYSTYLLRFKYNIPSVNTVQLPFLAFEVGLMLYTNSQYGAGRKTIYTNQFSTTTPTNVWVQAEQVFTMTSSIDLSKKYLYSFLLGGVASPPAEIFLDDFEIMPAIASISPYVTICEGEEAELETEVCINDENHIPIYSWNSTPYDASLFNHPVHGDQSWKSIIHVSPTVTTYYSCNVTYANGMNGTKYVGVTVNPKPVEPVISGIFYTCSPDPKTYTIDNYDPNYNYEFEGVGYFGPDPVTGNTFDIDWSQFTPFTNGRVQLRVIATDLTTGCFSESFYDVFECCTNGSPIVWTDETLNTSGIFYSQDIEINGTLRLEQGVVLELGNCNIRMGGNARIIVEDNAEISLDNVQMYSCDQQNMWDGIYLKDIDSKLSAFNNSEFSDAKNVIVADNGADFSVKNCAFDLNLIGIEAKNYNQTYNAIISNSDFMMSSTNLLYPYDANSKTVGINLLDILGNITVGDISKPNLENNFIGLGYGIYSSNSNFIVYHNIFTECGFGIDAEGNTDKANPNDTRDIIVGGNPNIYQPNSFISCYKCIRNTRNTNINISYNNFNECYWGVEIDNNAYSEVHLEANTLDNIAFKGISTNNTSSYIYMFDNHIITTTSSYENFGIVCATNCNSQNPNFAAETRIFENLIENAKRGIHIAGAEGLSVSSNTVKLFPLSVIFARFGIYVANVTAPDIKYNGVSLYNVTTQPTVADAFSLQGIRLMNCNNGYIRKNSITHMGSGIRMAANCLPTEISCNYLEDNYYGVQLENADIGNQGTANSPWDNEWYNTQANPNFLRIQGIIPAASSPIYWYHQNLIQLTLNPYATYCNVLPVGYLITSQTTCGNFCSTVVPPIAPLAQNFQLNPLPIPSQILNRDKELGGIINSFYPNNTLSGNYAANIILSNTQSFEQAKYFYKRILEEPAYMSLGTIDDSKYQQLMGIIAASNIPYFYNANEFVQQHNDSLALSQLNQVTPFNIWETDLKTAMHKFIQRKNQNLTKQDSIELKTIAYKNAHDIGEAAFIARNLLGLCIVDNYIPTVSSPKKKNEYNTSNLSNQDVKVYPNPTKDQITIEFSEPTEEFGQIIIVNMLGQQVLNKYFSSEQKVQINTNELESGVYFYNITKGNKTMKSDKLIIL